MGSTINNDLGADAATRDDPLNGFNYTVTFTGGRKVTLTGFKSCSGLDVSTTATKYREGNEATNAQRQIPGMTSFSNISLQRGITLDTTFTDWIADQAAGKIDRTELTITLQDNAHVTRRSWQIHNALVTKWTGPSFDATSDAIGIEQLELAHEGITMLV